MHFVRTEDRSLTAEKVAALINTKVSTRQKVLWLVSGGSAVDVAVQTRSLLASTKGLLIMQVDERFGLPGHPNSNWQKLLDAGLDLTDVTCWPVLTGKDLIPTAKAYAEHLAQALKEADYAIGLFGIGADGHTAGILPHSPAVEASGLIASYQGPDFTRLTITAAAIAQLDAAVVSAIGNSKLEALKNLQTDLPLADEPAQALKQVPDVWVYNDQIGELV